MGYEIIESGVVRDVKAEMVRQAQLKREGRFKHTPRDTDIPDTLKLAMLLEECGEVSRATLARAKVVQETEQDHSLKKELVQVAAIAIAWAEALGEESHNGNPVRW
jgi:NTP pyrophosphatase (non-canonical NTP hydrolase)